MSDKRPTIVAVSGFTSDSGKTSLMCELLRALPGWEAIKMTRGHYRSCGKDPHACCVSPLLGDEPVVRSGRAATYAAGKDTGRYWDAGASNVHWVIATDRQVEEGSKLALARVRSAGVLIEGNSFLKFIDADFTIVVARAGADKIKASARHALSKASALYLFGDESASGADEHRLPLEWQRRAGLIDLMGHVPLYSRDDLSRLVEAVESAHALNLSRSSVPVPL